MKNQPTLAQLGTGSYQADLTRYQAILAEIHSYVDSFAPPLQAMARPFFERLAQGEFSQVVALLPYWLADILPVAPEVSHWLGIAHLYGWWYYAAQDELLDHEAPPAALLGGHLALLKMIEIYQRLGVAHAACWADFARLALISAEFYAVELQTRFTHLAELTPNRLSLLNVEFIINRGAPFYFNTIAQLYLADIPAHDSRRQDLPAALRYFSAARQISDDAGDWLADLQRGQLNYVSAQLIQRLYRRGLVRSGTDLDPERLAGYQLQDEAFWTEIEQTTYTLSQQALDCLAPYGERRLQTLIRRQMARQAEQWAAARTQRNGLRQIFSLSFVS